MKINEAQQLNSYTVMDDREYTHYRAYKNIKKENRIKGRPAYKKFVKTYLKIIADELLEREGGVCIKRFAYWFNWMPPRKIIGGYFSKEGQEEMYSFVTDHHLYFPTFWTTKEFVFWTMDKSFNKTFKINLKNKIKSGKKYKMYLGSIREMNYL